MRLCTILAREGSVGVVGKNMRTMNGKPLIAWSIEQALNSNFFDLVAVSSDSSEILEISRKYGAQLTIQRPKQLAQNDSPRCQH